MHNIQVLDPGFDPNVLGILARFQVAPLRSEAMRYQRLIVGLKQDGTWWLLDNLWNLAAHDAQAGLVNLRRPDKSLIAANNITFTQYRGYTGDGVSMYLGPAEPWDAPGNIMSLNSLHLGVWCNQQNGSTGLFSHATIVAGSTTLNVRAIGTTGNETFRAGDATTETARVGTSTRTGYRTTNRTASNVKRAYYNGVRTANLTTASTAIPTAHASLLRDNTTYCPDRLALAHSGGGLTDDQVAMFYARFNTFLSEVGAN